MIANVLKILTEKSDSWILDLISLREIESRVFLKSHSVGGESCIKSRTTWLGEMMCSGV